MIFVVACVCVCASISTGKKNKTKPRAKKKPSKASGGLSFAALGINSDDAMQGVDDGDDDVNNEHANGLCLSALVIDSDH